MHLGGEYPLGSVHRWRTCRTWWEQPPLLSASAAVILKVLKGTPEERLRPSSVVGKSFRCRKRSHSQRRLITTQRSPFGGSIRA